MGEERTAEFDDALRALWAAQIGSGKFDVQVSMSLVRGKAVSGIL